MIRNEKTDGSRMNRPFCAGRWRKRREHGKTTFRQWIFFCFFSSKKKRDKRHGGRGRPTEKRRYSAHPIRNEKTDGSRMNRPFCATRWRKRREHRKTTLRQWIFFCFFSSKKKRDKRHGGRGRPTEKRRFSAHDSKRKNGRFAYEPSVLRSTLARPTGARENNVPAMDFLLLLFF